MIKNKENRGFLEVSWNLMGPFYPNLIITEPAELVIVKLLLDAVEVVLITGLDTSGSKVIPSVVPLTTNLFAGVVVPMVCRME